MITSWQPDGYLTGALAVLMAGARTPEELETLLEDAGMLHDPQALAHLFKPGAMLIVSGGLAEARDPRRVFQARDTALVLAGRAIDVVRRTGNGSWRYAISLLELDKATQQR